MSPGGNDRSISASGATTLWSAFTASTLKSAIALNVRDSRNARLGFLLGDGDLYQRHLNQMGGNGKKMETREKWCNWFGGGKGGCFFGADPVPPGKCRNPVET